MPVGGNGGKPGALPLRSASSRRTTGSSVSHSSSHPSAVPNGRIITTARASSAATRKPCDFDGASSYFVSTSVSPVQVRIVVDDDRLWSIELARSYAAAAASDRV